MGIANPAPFPGTAELPNGSSRPGDNLYTDSLVALDLETGALRWYHQVTPHDLFDRDQVHAQLVDARRRRRGRELRQVRRGRRARPRRRLRPLETEVGRHDNDDLTELDGPTTVAPGTYGGVLTPPASARRRRVRRPS